MVSGPPNKRKSTENNDDDELYVTYADYMQLHNHLTKLTAVVSDIHLAIINFGGKQLADHVAFAIPHIGFLLIAAPRPAPINWAAVVKAHLPTLDILLRLSVKPLSILSQSPNRLPSLWIRLPVRCLSAFRIKKVIIHPLILMIYR
uniref:Uncharacterized protein n=1 Tax=Caenorhabditis japonica TaxID=281687 RepID=A0A8R1HTI2_CAEJA